MDDFKVEKLTLNFKDYTNLDISILKAEIEFLESFKNELIKKMNLSKNSIKIEFVDIKNGSKSISYNIFSPFTIDFYKKLVFFIKFQNFVVNSNEIKYIKTKNSNNEKRIIFKNEKNIEFELSSLVYKISNSKNLIKLEKIFWSKLNKNKTKLYLLNKNLKYIMEESEISFLNKNLLKINSKFPLSEIIEKEEKETILEIKSINLKKKIGVFKISNFKIKADIIDENFNPNEFDFSIGKYMKVKIKKIRYFIIKDSDIYEDKYEITKIIDSNFRFKKTNILEMISEKEKYKNNINY